ncbi:MAG: hypothetical protein ACKVIS_15005 [Pseudomonadales bacterium]|uniref:hypothetical protein n=1 Tax=uncultured Pseudomonas sp. TaxID=114707 RepID=UPI0030DC55D4|tara:strand:- start:1449 stop:1874 length:426 start_codon:yes stop_codon:yes gene_type:complete
MNAAEVLTMAKAEGVTLVLVGDRLTWKADHQPPDDLLSTIKTHKRELIEVLGAANDPGDPPQHYIQTAVTASREWLAARNAFYNHIMPCRSCHAPTGRYCLAGAELRQRYDQTPMVDRREKRVYANGGTLSTTCGRVSAQD